MVVLRVSAARERSRITTAGLGTVTVGLGNGLLLLLSLEGFLANLLDGFGAFVFLARLPASLAQIYNVLKKKSVSNLKRKEGEGRESLPST